MEEKMTANEPKIFKWDRGYTIVEVLVGIVLLSFGILAVAQMQIMTMNSNKLANQKTMAITLAQDKAEYFRTIPYTTIGNTPLSDSVGSYTRSWVVENNTPANNMKRVTITVSWSGKQVQMQTIIASGDL
jgi:type IV pilus assembly protein PilV